MRVNQLIKTERSWRHVAYFIPAAVALYVGLWSMDDDGYRSVWIYLLILGMVLFQFFRPTILGWWLCILPFAAFAIAILLTGDSEAHEIGFVLGVIPCIALLCAYPWSRKSTSTNLSSHEGTGQD